MSGKNFKIIGNDISDGYHTFQELYAHRSLLYANLCLKDSENSSWRPDFEGWFLLYWESPWGQISYHLPDEYLDLIKDKIKLDLEHKWDGHTSKDVLNRLASNTEEKNDSP